MRRFETRWSGEVVCTIDMLLALAVILLALFVLAAPPRPKAEAAEQGTPLGALTVMVSWPAGADTDVDTWVLAPGEARAIGYSNKNGRFFDLLRDDLGFANDASGLNFELAATRGLPAGEYIVNLHLFSSRSALPIAVKVVASIQRQGEKGSTTIATRDVTLSRLGEELTVVRFRLDERGGLAAGSVNELPRKLRDAS